MASKIIEICSYSLQSALNAQLAGAQRVELCDNMHEGGTTPSFAAIKIARELLEIKLHVIIRPRGGDFLYSEQEIEIMKEDIKMAKKLGTDGVVIGCLTRNGDVNTNLINDLLYLAKPMSVTFHRAFDMVKDPYKALDDLIQLNVDRVLTSGQRQTAMEGKKLIAELVEKAENKIIIMPGSGLNETNIVDIADYTNAKEFHLSAKQFIDSRMNYKNQKINLDGSENKEYGFYESDFKTIKNVVKLLC